MTALDYAKQWEDLAKEEDHKAAIDAQAGHNTSANHERAKFYRRTAESFRLEAKTGKPHCACCLKPLGTH